MENVLIYLLKAHLVASLLFGTYFLLLKNSVYLKLNRFILLGMIFLTLLLPFLPMVRISLATDLLKTTSPVNPLPGIIDHIEKPANKLATKEKPVQANFIPERSSGNNYLYLIAMIYAFVAAVLLLKFIWQIGHVFRFLRKHKPVPEGRLRYLNPGVPVAPFSFFNYIVINRHLYKENEFKQVVVHEKAHADQWHSVDILLAELFHVFMWCNPMIKAMKAAVKLNLEYLADDKVLNEGFNKADYQRGLIRHLLNLQTYKLANSYHSKTKLRIKRMNSEKYTNGKIYLYLLLLPVIAAIYILINPLDAKALNRLNLQSYTGFYELSGPKTAGTVAVKMVIKNDHLVMQTLWNGKEIWFEKLSEFKFINRKASFPLEFSKEYPVSGRDMTAFNKDRWYKVTDKNYKPVSVKDGQEERWIFAYDQNGGVHSAVYTVNPWDEVKHYKPPG